MPKRGRKGSSQEKKKKSSREVYEYVSDDDERLYGDKAAPDPESRDYFYDDIDEFHAKREKILIDEGVQEDNKYIDSDEEEVLALDSSDSDDDEIRNLKAQLRKVNQIRKKSAIGSDLEDNDDEEEDDDDEAGLPDSKAWGQKRKKYYGEEDLVLSDLDDEEGNAALEEKEALKLQRQMAEQLDDQDFGLDIFKPAQEEKESIEKEQKIVKDLSKLSKREKLQLLKKESPELLTLIDEFKEKLTEVQEKLEPLRTLIEERKVTGKAADYIHTKFRLNLNYCINIAFYLVLKAKQSPVHNHPVIKRLLQYRNLLKQLEPLDIQLKDEVTDILSRLSKGEDIKFDSGDDLIKQGTKKFVRRKPAVGLNANNQKKKKLREMVSDSDQDQSDDLYEDVETSPKKKAKKSKLEGQYETKDEKAALDYYKMMKTKGSADDDDYDDGEDDEFGVSDYGDNMEDDEGHDLDGNEQDVEGKRAISHQIEKNKGLTARKKKELRNPRVKHRMKFKKAKTRRKGQIREVRTEMQRYGGEMSGIRAGIKRGIKLK